MKRKVNIGIIGCGSIFRSMHLPSLVNLADKFNIVSIFDADKDAIKLTTKIINNSSHVKYTDSAEVIFRDPEIDAVAVLTSTSVHVKYTLQALKHGKHVFLEKPAAVLPKDVKRIIAAEKKYRRFVQVGMVLRYSSFYEELCRIIDSQKYGKVLWMNWLETRPFDPMIWRYSDSSENGDAIIHDKAIHQINLFNRFAGAKPAETAAFGGQYLINPKTYSKVRAFRNEVMLKGDSNDNLMAIIKYKNGVKASITVSYVSPHARESRWIIQLEKAKIVAHFETFVSANRATKRKWEGNPSSIYIFADDKKYPVVWKYPMSYPPNENNLAFYDEYKDEHMHPGSGAQWKAFYDTITKSSKPESNTSVALEDIIVAKAIDEAIKKKKVIRISH
jgi:predicted dehydrogenase